MHLSRDARALGSALAICAVLGGVEHVAGQEPPSYRWYVSAAGGTNSGPVMKQAGHNRDTICYPTFLCPAAPAGYRWSYDLAPESGTALEVAVGRNLGWLRLDVSVAQRSNGIKEAFTGLTFLDRTPVLPNAESRYTSSNTTSVDALTLRTLSLNAYRDFHLGESRFVPYLGAGLGLSSTELSGLYFSSEYSCINEPCGGRPKAEYNSRQDVDLSDHGLAALLFAGAEYRVADRLLVGLKAAYGWIQDLEATSRYDLHPLPGTNTNEISGIRLWSAILALKYLLGA
ncbi:MAG: hypothetical protein OXI46_03985 [Gemmatimonadota bacterium]|nr:hypothetical protein [Gemmatimonadota bacterium]